jgi:lipopolysaccharide/colanic/teichoic acid biosynthesis glycosyltransferase
MSINSLELGHASPLDLMIDAIWVPPLAQRYGMAKRAFDATVSAILFAPLLPLLGLLMLITKLTSPGPCLYSQTRVGRNGRLFTMHKVRTMIPDSERETGPVWSTPEDARVTPFGRFLRRTHLDELPQFWNIVRGDMSLVGPRPERPEFIRRLEADLPHYPRRLLVTPGLTGLAQVRLPPDTDTSDVRRKLAFDLYYIERRSLWLDVRLCLCTGCLWLGVPFRTSCRLMRVPTPRAVARAFPGLLYQPAPMARATAGAA